MIRNVLSHIGGVELYGILSILIFFSFFIGMLVWVFRLRRPHLDTMAALPLQEDTATVTRESNLRPETQP